MTGSQELNAFADGSSGEAHGLGVIKEGLRGMTLASEGMPQDTVEPVSLGNMGEETAERILIATDIAKTLADEALEAAQSDSELQQQAAEAAHNGGEIEFQEAALHWDGEEGSTRLEVTDARPPAELRMADDLPIMIYAGNIVSVRMFEMANVGSPTQ